MPWNVRESAIECERERVPLNVRESAIECERECH